MGTALTIAARGVVFIDTSSSTEDGFGANTVWCEQGTWTIRR
jgi:hypothetical protein